MTNAELFPPGRVLWAIRDTDLHPAHRIIPDSSTSDSTKSKLRLFDVLDVVAVFGQIVFARDMLRSKPIFTKVAIAADQIIQLSHASAI